MPKSKKPRKTYKHKNRPIYRQYFRHEDIAGLKETFTRIETIAEISLPLGKCTEDDVSVFRDFLNTATSLICCDKLDETDYYKEHLADYPECIDHFETYLKRTIKTGNYTATAAEINGIRRGIEIAGEIIGAEFELRPAWVLDCYRGTKHITDKVNGRMEIDSSYLAKQVKRIAASNF